MPHAERRPAFPRLFPLRVLMLSTLALTACACGGGDAADPEKVTPYVVKGVVRDQAGNPIPNAKVDAHDSVEGGYTSAITNAEGVYNIRLDPKRVTAYYVVAEHNLSWDGQDWSFALEPDNANHFQADEGAIRNFTWVLEGETKVGVLFHGGEVIVTADLASDPLEPDHIEVDFAPKGPRIDGSPGEPFTMKLSEGAVLSGVALGHYTVTARDVVDPSLEPVLRLYEDDDGSFHPSLDVGFRSEGHSGQLNLTVSIAE